MGTPEFAVPSLRTLIETQDVVGVVTQPDKPAGRGNRLQAPPVKQVAEAAGLPVYQPKSLRSEEAAEPLRDWAPDAIVVAAFGQILRPHILYLPTNGSINVHASLLPRWRGASPIHHAILAGDAETGITLMHMEEGLDTGPMYVQERLRIGDRETSAELHDRLAALGADMVRRHLDDILGGKLLPVAQDDSLSSYAPMIKKEAGQIDWAQANHAIDHLVRSMTPWPGAFTAWNGQPLRIWEAVPVANMKPQRPGLVTQTDTGVFVHTGEGGLELVRLQLAGKRPLEIAEFVRGRPDFVGSVLGASAATSDRSP
jgi:methionyl-tRNA formyltransferase